MRSHQRNRPQCVNSGTICWLRLRSHWHWMWASPFGPWWRSIGNWFYQNRSMSFSPGNDQLISTHDTHSSTIYVFVCPFCITVGWTMWCTRTSSSSSFWKFAQHSDNIHRERPAWLASPFSCSPTLFGSTSSNTCRANGCIRCSMFSTCHSASYFSSWFWYSDWASISLANTSTTKSGPPNWNNWNREERNISKLPRTEDTSLCPLRHYYDGAVVANPIINSI